MIFKILFFFLLYFIFFHLPSFTLFTEVFLCITYKYIFIFSVNVSQLSSKEISETFSFFFLNLGSIQAGTEKLLLYSIPMLDFSAGAVGADREKQYQD